jgi:hypothetical protein
MAMAAVGAPMALHLQEAVCFTLAKEEEGASLQPKPSLCQRTELILGCDGQPDGRGLVLAFS